MHEFRLGDELDDFCIKCKRLTNHAIVSLLNGLAAKVRCRTCYHDHDFRNGEPMPSKKDLKKQALFDQVLAGTVVPVAPVADLPTLPVVETEEEAVTAPAAVEAEATNSKAAPAAKKARKTAKSSS